jgi:hypothetical protein
MFANPFGLGPRAALEPLSRGSLEGGNRDA